MNLVKREKSGFGIAIGIAFLNHCLIIPHFKSSANAAEYHAQKCRMVSGTFCQSACVWSSMPTIRMGNIFFLSA
jgi:hypothetical protein